MLTLTIPLCSLLLLPLFSSISWHLISISLIILTATTIPSIMSYSNTTMLSNISMLDTMSTSLICLTLWIGSLMFMASYSIFNKKNMSLAFSLTVLSLLLILVLCFSAANLFHFYVWFEASLIPTMLLIMLWGYQPERIQSSMYLMVYTVVASLPLLLMICKISHLSGHLSMAYPWMSAPHILSQSTVWLIMVAAFMVKLPLFSVHLWLPKAHVEAPVAGSMVLAAILLKLGGYGLMRVVMLFPHMNNLLYAPLTSLALIGATMTSFICLRQSDLKSLIAYSSIGHMGLMVAGTLSNSYIGMWGSLAMMIAHGLVSSAMFCMANITYEFTHTRSINLTGGILAYLPILTMWWFLFTCANMAAPPSINLLSEILLISSALSHNLILAIPLAMISFFTAAYSLYLFSAMNHGWPLLISNPSLYISQHYMLLMIMHLSPVITLILCPNFITNWC